MIRISGPDAYRAAGLVVSREITRGMAGRFFRCAMSAPGGGRIDDGLALVFAAPRSYTGEDVVELQCHGGSVTPRRVLEACVAAGVRLARRGEFTQRAFLNGRMDLGAAEAVIDLVDAKTDRAADDAVERLSGGESGRFGEMYGKAVELGGRIEHALDFDEEELPRGFGEDLERGVEELAGMVEAKLSTAREGKILREGALVVLAGEPNAGKSSLMNALLGENRAIVSDEAGTTRDSIEEWLDVGGWPVRLTDTAGLRDAENAVESEGVARAEELIARADLVLALDCELPGALRVHAKCDLGGGEGINVSSRTGEGLDRLREAMAERLAEMAAKRSEESGADATTRQKELLSAAGEALAGARRALRGEDWVVAAEELRTAAEALGKILGKVYTEDLLDALFSRFCIGK